MKKAFLLLLLVITLNLGAQSTADTTNYHAQAVEAMMDQRYAEAISLLEQALATNVDMDIALYNKGICHMSLEQYQVAINTFAKAIEITESDQLRLRAIYQSAYLQRNKTKDLVSALQNTERGIAIDSLHIQSHYMRGLVLHDMGRWEEAIKSFNVAIALNPSNPGAYYDRGVAKRKLGKVEEAIADYTITINLDPSYDRAYNNRGYAKMTIEDYEGAILDYTAAIRITNSAYAYNNRGYARLKLGDLENARIDCEKSIELDPENSWAYHYLGLVYYEMGKQKKACGLFQQALQLGKEEVMEDINEKCN